MTGDGRAAHEPETTTFRRTRRGVVSGAVVGAVAGAVIGLIAGGAGAGWGSTAMWVWTLVGLIGATVLGAFIGGMSSLSDPTAGDEPTPDPAMRGDTDLPLDTGERRTGLPPEASSPLTGPQAPRPRIDEE